jgi:hypothetical protein
MSKPRRFRLDIVGELEDRPRLLRAYGRVRGAELAVVLRPTEQRGLFVVLGKESCTLWEHQLEVGEKRTVGKLKIGKRTEVQVGAKVFQISGELQAGLANGQVVPVAVKNGRVRVLVGGDAPRVGKVEVRTPDAVAKVKALQRGVPAKGPHTLRGRWTGALIWDGAQPSVEVKRKLAAYGELVCRSAPQGWSWSFERAKRWYSGEKREEGAGYHTLMDAIEAGLTAAMLLVREACGVRDTSRRAALDEVWAERHPLPTPKERANPTDKLGAKGCGCSKKASEPSGARAPTRKPARPTDPITGRTYDRMPRESGESVYTYARRMVTEANTRIGEGHHGLAKELLDEAGRVAAGLSSSKAMRVHHYADQIRERLPQPERPDAGQSDKDQLLLSAFQQAIAGALS